MPRQHTGSARMIAFWGFIDPAGCVRIGAGGRRDWGLAGIYRGSHIVGMPWGNGRADRPGGQWSKFAWTLAVCVVSSLTFLAFWFYGPQLKPLDGALPGQGAADPATAATAGGQGSSPGMFTADVHALVSFSRAGVRTTSKDGTHEMNVASLGMARPPLGSLMAPLETLIPTSQFGLRRNPLSGSAGEFHWGQDYGSPCGTRVYAADGGAVRAVGWHPWGGGNRVEVDHQNGLITTYNHLQATAVNKGESVQVGEVIARVGTTGSSTGCHLHFETIRNGAHTNPSQWTLLPIKQRDQLGNIAMTSYLPGTNAPKGAPTWAIPLRQDNSHSVTGGSAEAEVKPPAEPRVYDPPQVVPPPPVVPPVDPQPPVDRCVVVPPAVPPEGCPVDPQPPVDRCVVVPPAVPPEGCPVDPQPPVDRCVVVPPAVPPEGCPVDPQPPVDRCVVVPPAVPPEGCPVDPQPPVDRCVVVPPAVPPEGCPVDPQPPVDRCVVVPPAVPPEGCPVDPQPPVDRCVVVPPAVPPEGCPVDPQPPVDRCVVVPPAVPPEGCPVDPPPQPVDPPVDAPVQGEPVAPLPPVQEVPILPPPPPAEQPQKIGPQEAPESVH
ncbi:MULTISPECIES: M23 family metallopeptidase [unclassified Arthrobacter]|uniref:M23 family metallopeptidase n=1 Tax=unclassified Arthrobacter TaxID=235627 RepID=UPI0027D7AFCB|nr:MULTISPECIES: M23 family metallopeptidase [unclassified Arthrobacter]